MASDLELCVVDSPFASLTFPVNLTCGTDGELTDYGRLQAEDDGAYTSAEDIYVPVEDVDEAAAEYMSDWKDDIADILRCHNFSATQRAAMDKERRRIAEAREPRPP